MNIIITRIRKTTIALDGRLTIDGKHICDTTENADCHLAIHYDSSTNDKGFFYINVPSNESYRSMEPVASHWQQHNALGDAVLSGVIDYGNHICGSGSMEMDLTQTSYSTIPSIDIECGDQASDWSYGTQERIAEGIAEGVARYFGVSVP